MTHDDEITDDEITDREIARAAAINAGVFTACALVAVGFAVAFKTDDDGSNREGVFWLMSYAFGALAVLYGLNARTPLAELTDHLRAAARLADGAIAAR